MRFRQFIENVSYWNILFDISSYSSGWHGHDERPAGNCFDFAKWEPNFKQENSNKLESLLRGKSYAVIDHASFRSYHECQVSMHVLVEADEEILELLEYKSSGPPSKRIVNGTFVNFNKLHDEVSNAMHINSSKPDADSSEEWWAKKIAIEKSKQKRTFDGD